tara:strand:+ start:326 stop:520 length:195 start_codon:yes stop_codon:yes gene_type:complete
MKKNEKLKRELFSISKKNGLNLKNIKKFDSIQLAELMITLEGYYKTRLSYEDLVSVEKIIKKIS